MKNKFEQIIGAFLSYTTVTSLILFYLYLLNYKLKMELNNDNVYINLFTFVTLAISGLIFLFVLIIFNKEKTRPAANISFIIIYVIIEIVICYIFGQVNVPYSLIPFTIVQYVLFILIFDTFKYHTEFINSIADKDGKELETYLYHNNLYSLDLAEKNKNTLLVLTAYSLIYSIGILIFELNKNKLTLPLVLLSIIFYFSVFAYVMLIFFFNKESYYANLGIKDILKNKRTYIRNIFMVFIIANILGAVFSIREPVFNLTFKEIDTVDNRTEFVTPPVIEYENTTTFEKVDLDEVLGNSKDNPLWDKIWKIVELILGGSAAIYLLLKFIKPFFSSEWKEFWKEHRFSKYLNELFNTLIEFFKELFSFGKTDDDYSKVEYKDFRDNISAYIKHSKKSKEKKIELDRITQKFMYVIKWGEKNSIDYKKSMAPLEYCNLIIEFLNNENADGAMKKAAETVGQLFEKALYDKELLTKDEENEYNNAVGQLTIVK